MRFKDWCELDEARFKGFQRQFRQNYPNLPRYVQDQLYTNRFGADLGRSIRQQAQRQATVAYTPGRPANTLAYGHTPGNPGDPNATIAPTNSPRPSPHDILGNNSYLVDVQWSPKPSVITVSPLDFDRSTLDLFLTWRFGFNPKDSAVRNDSQRFDTQRQLMTQKQDGDNEPIIVVKDGNKYKLLEGFHRTMLFLLSPYDGKGAPPDQIELLKAGQSRGLDFTKWGRIPILAYVGVKQTNRSAPGASGVQPHP